MADSVNLLRLSEHNHGKLADAAFEALSNGILRGDLKPGQRLREVAVADALGISRTPVREAFGQLERVNLLAKDVAGGYHVARWDKHTLWEVATLRSVLEGLAARLAIPNLTPADFDVLESIVYQMRPAAEREDYERLILVDIRFHGHIWSRTDSKLLQKVLDDIRLQVHYFMLLTRLSNLLEYESMHKEIIDVLRAGDPDHAEAVMRKHILRSAELLISPLEDGEVKLYGDGESFSRG